MALLLVAVGCSADDRARGSDTRPTSASETSQGSPTAPTTTIATPDDALLLPDLSSLPAEDVHLEVTADGSRLLRFAAVLANTGDGPVVVRPDESQPCPPGQRFASQVVYVDANDDDAYQPAVDTETSVSPAGCMVDHPTHDHWHLDASAQYVLSTAAPGREPIVSADKVSFCLRDTRPLVVDPDTLAPQAYDGCDRDSVQGITVGWGDVYRSDLDGQALPLPADLADGQYCLSLRADPLDLMREIDDANNAAVVGVRITETTATVAPAASCLP